jgi:hypothetical protein
MLNAAPLPCRSKSAAAGAFQTTREVNAVGWDVGRDGLDEEPKTFLQAWCADLTFAERYFPEKAAQLRAAGPPEPTPNEPHGFRIAYYRHHAERGDQEVAEILEMLRADGR